MDTVDVKVFTLVGDVGTEPVGLSSGNAVGETEGTKIDERGSSDPAAELR